MKSAKSAAANNLKSIFAEHKKAIRARRLQESRIEIDVLYLGVTDMSMFVSGILEYDVTLRVEHVVRRLFRWLRLRGNHKV